MKGKEGWCVLSLRVAVWASLTATDFRYGLIKAVSDRRRTDTYAAMRAHPWRPLRVPGNTR